MTDTTGSTVGRRVARTNSRPAVISPIGDVAVTVDGAPSAATNRVPTPQIGDDPPSDLEVTNLPSDYSVDGVVFPAVGVTVSSLFKETEPVADRVIGEPTRVKLVKDSEPDRPSEVIGDCIPADNERPRSTAAGTSLTTPEPLEDPILNLRMASSIGTVTDSELGVPALTETVAEHY